MATPPTFVSEYEATWNTDTTPRTTSVTVAVGDVLVVVAITADEGSTLNTPTGGTGFSWTLQQSSVVTDYCNAYVWTTTATQAQTFTLSVSGTIVGGNFWGFNCLRFSGSDGIGASTKTNVASGAPSLALTTLADNSAVVCVVGDWQALDGTTRTWRTINSSTGVEATYFRDSSQYTVYANRWNDVGTIGSKTTGLSAPGAQKYTIIAVEIKGAAGAAVASLLLPPAKRLLPILVR